jgi:hypothetical protein
MLCIYGNKDFILENCSISGKVILKSDSLITIKSNCNLKNVIVQSPNIIIEENFIGSLQLFCTDSVVVRRNVKLNFPSVILLKTESGNGGISILENSMVSGMIGVIDSNERKKSELIFIDSEVKIDGFIYSNSNIIFNGHCDGFILCNQIRSDFPGKVLENTIINTQITKSFDNLILSSGIWQPKILKTEEIISTL